MTRVRISIADNASVPSAVRIDRAIDRCGLGVSMRGTLAKYPGCAHWHLKKGRERGTLEVTLWPRERRLWLSVQSGRTGPWIDGAIKQLKAALEELLSERSQ